MSLRIDKAPELMRRVVNSKPAQVASVIIIAAAGLRAGCLPNLNQEIVIPKPAIGTPTVDIKPTTTIVTPTIAARLPELDLSKGVDRAATELLWEIDWLRNNNNPDQLLRGAKNRVIKEVLAYRALTGSDEVGKPNTSTVAIKGKVFALEEASSRMYADALLQTMLADKLRDRSVLIHYPQETARRINDLILMRQFEFVDTNKSIPLVKADELALLQPAVSLLQKSGKSLPAFMAVSTEEAEYDSGKDTLYLKKFSPVTSLAAYYLSKDPELAAKLRETLEAPQYKPLDPNLIRFPELGSAPAVRVLATDEQLGELFSAFVVDGQTYRNRISYLEAIGDKKTAALLQAEYEVMAKWLGTETIFESQQYHPLKLTANQSFRVTEFFRKGEGIIVRREPVTERDPRGWAFSAFDGDNVAAVDGLVQRVVYPEILTARNMAKVRSIDEKEGWMPVEYLQPVKQN